MRNIYSYLDYRQYLEDFYKEKKKNNSNFSYQFIANQIGFKSKSLFKGIINGDRNLTAQYLAKINKILKLSNKQFSYFSDLVAFNHEKKRTVKDLLLQKLLEYNQNNRAKLIISNQYEYYNKWYHHTLRELIQHIDFKDDYKLLASLVKPEISVRQAKASIKLLLKLGLIKKENGRFVQSDTITSTGDEVRAIAVSNYHLQNLMLAGESIDTVPSEERDISNLVLGVSDEGIDQVKNEIKKFRKKLLLIAEKQKNISRVYNVNFQMYPVSGVLDDNK